MSLEEKLTGVATKIINPKIGILTGSIGAISTYFVNACHGFFPAIFASGKQFAFSFLFGGFIGKTCQHFANIENKYIAWTLGEIVPGILANSILYTIHKLGGTPEPLKSLVVPAIIGLGVYSPTIIHLTRKGYLR